MSEERKLEAGEKELGVAFEDATRKNVKSVIQHANDTRGIVREMEEKVKRLENNHQAALAQIAELRKQLSILQGRFYSAGTTSYADSEE